jgi:choice-of-anchor A domain-containing protein/uncharacterized repeat protein (TIGR01451 family)
MEEKLSKNTLLNTFAIILLSLLFVGQNLAQDKASNFKNIGKFVSASENGNQKDLQGASTAVISGSHIGTNIKFEDPYDTNKKLRVFAGTFSGNLDGNNVKFYCIDIDHKLAKNEDYSDQGPTPIEITYILNNYYPYANYPYSGSASSVEIEAAAIQAVIWHFADNMDLSTIEQNNVKNRAEEIYNDVFANSSSAVYPDYFTISPPFRNLVGGITADFTVTAFDTDGNPYSGLIVNLTTTSGNLSASQITTDLNGVANFTLDQNSGNFATISATAQVTIPQGTKYFHVQNPDGKQKLVLATPAVATGSASADVNWYTSGDCDLHNFTTYTQGGWTGPSNGGPGKVRDAGFDTVFPSGLTVGGTKTLTFTSAEALKNMKTGGSSSYLERDYTNPTNKTSAGNFASQLVSATANVYYHDAGFLGTNITPLGSLVFKGGDFDGMTIYDFLTLANDAIGGNQNTGYSYSQFMDAATKINENFDEGSVNKRHFTCPAPPEPDCENTLGDYIWHDSNVNGIQDNNELGIESVVVELYNESDVLISFTSTDNTGYYEFTTLENGTYVVKVADENFTSGGVFEGSANEKWYLTLQQEGNNNEIDSDGNDDKSATVIIDCNDDFTIDFGFFQTCMTFEKTGPQSVNAGEPINYTFTVVNCGDLVLAGGVSVYDAKINPDNDHFIRNKTVQPGATWTFNASYPTSELDCGNLLNTANAVGHPQMPDGGVNLEIITAEDSWTVDVICNPKATLGDRVWYDENKDGIQDLGEDGVENVTVNLYNCLDVFVATTTTDEDGYYLFENLEVGNYYVQFVLPTDYLFSPQNEGTDVQVDSDADQTTGKTTCTDLISGEVDLSWDAGIYTEVADNFDLTIEKTASNTNPDDEPIVNYTITVTNNGNVEGTNITVSDVLPAGLIYQSSSPSGYDEITGVWNVGNIAAGGSKSLNISIKIDYTSVSEAPIFDLGIASPYNLFVLKDAVQPSSDTEGKVAVGRNATFGRYSIGDKLPLSGGTEDVLIVGRKLTYTSGQVFSGNVVYGKYLDVQQINLCSDGSIRKEDPVPVDFSQATTDLNALSSQLATRAATGTTTFEWGGLTLNGNEPILNVFEVDGNDMSAANSMEINVPNGSVVLVNVNRNNVSWTGGLVVNGTAVGNVLYNFHKANNITIKQIDIRGSILAPKAKVNFVSGVINGQMICKFFEGQGQMNNSLFHGSIHGNPEITNCAEITGVDQIEDNTDNNISCAPIFVNVDYNPNNGGSANQGAEWVEFGGNSLNEMIWSMYQSNNGLIVGTVGGNIYSNDGNTFTLLNDGMEVTYIWSLYEFNGNLYAGTELGLFKYDGSSWNKVAMDGDVRSITSIDNNLYAAVWGGGVYVSSDNGATWAGMSEGLIMASYSVHTLTVADGNLLAGTFGLGVLKYDFTNNIWVELPVGYDFIWSLATDIDGTIYAGSYGGGAYISTDNGDSWSQINSGLPNKYIYSVSVYGNDVYISTWSAGVYKFELGALGKAGSGTPSVASSTIEGYWASIGMGGIEVSSIMVDESTQTLYAGTSEGTIYKMKDGVTGVGDDSIAPTKFALEQNYPNPFNPSTKIEFSIPEAGAYSLKVYNVLGQEVAIIADQDFSAGKYTFNFDASNLTSGIYFYKFVGENINMTKKMMLLK